MGTARLPNWRRKACADFDAGQNIPLLHYSHDNRTFYARFFWVGRLTPVHGRDVIPSSLLCSQAGRRLSQPFMRRPTRMLRPRREMFAAPAASSRACMRWKTLSDSAARAFEARKSGDGIRTRSPFVAISGMRLSFVAISKLITRLLKTAPSSVWQLVWQTKKFPAADFDGCRWIANALGSLYLSQVERTDRRLEADRARLGRTPLRDFIG
jgi:hypothetical protein